VFVSVVFRDLTPCMFYVVVNVLYAFGFKGWPEDARFISQEVFSIFIIVRIPNSFVVLLVSHG